MAHKNIEPIQPASSNKKIGLEKLPGRNLRQCVVCSKTYEIGQSDFIFARCKKGLNGIYAGKQSC